MKNNSLLKTILIVFSAVVLVFSCCLTAFADETVLNVDNSQKDISVYVKFVDNTEWNIVPIDKNGKGTDTLPDGTAIEISGADSDKGHLVIDIIFEKEAIRWIDSVIAGKVKTPQVFHIYYIDTKGNMKDADGVTVTIKPNDTPQNAAVYSLNSDGKTTLLDFSAKDGAITFTVTGDPYYVIGEKVDTSIIPDSSSPPTGNTGNMLLWLLLAMFSGVALIGTGVCERRRKITESQWR